VDRGSRALGNRGVLVSSASTVLFFAVITVVAVLSPGSGIVAERFFSPHHLWQSLVGSASNPSVLGAFLLNVKIFTVSVLGSVEAVRAAQIYSASEFNYASYVVAAFLFVLITIPLARFTDRLIARDKRRREAGALA
jgi:hypothetical protein